MKAQDEFFGNLYHLNAEEDPEDPDYPKEQKFKERYGPRGFIHSWAMEKMEAAWAGGSAAVAKKA